VARLAAGIRALGAQAGDRVAVLSLNSDRYLELYLAAGWSGTVIVPLNIRWSPLENEDAMRDCRAGILFVEQHVALALEVADRAYVLNHGRLVLDGPAADLRDRPDLLRSSYLGDGAAPAAA